MYSILVKMEVKIKPIKVGDKTYKFERDLFQNIKKKYTNKTILIIDVNDTHGGKIIKMVSNNGEVNLSDENNRPVLIRDDTVVGVIPKINKKSVYVFYIPECDYYYFGYLKTLKRSKLLKDPNGKMIYKVTYNTI